MSKRVFSTPLNQLNLIDTKRSPRSKWEWNHSTYELPDGCRITVSYRRKTNVATSRYKLYAMRKWEADENMHPDHLKHYLDIIERNPSYARKRGYLVTN